MNRYVDINAKCPFYASEDKWRIYCEGVCKGTSIQLTFNDEKKKKPYKVNNCHSDKCYETCLIAKMLLSKYEGEDK